MNQVMLKDIVSQPEALKDGLGRLREQVGELQFGSVRRVILTGSGDSYIAALAVEDLVRYRFSGDVSAMPSLDASRYLQHEQGDLVVVVSVSGEVARTIEVAERASRSGASTIAITCNASSTLSLGCDHQLVMPEPIDRSIPHSRDYTATLLALTVLAEKLGGETFPELDAWVSVVESVIANAFDVLEEMVWDRERWWFLGAGPDRVTAMFGALKFWEAAGMEAWWDDLEEFAHGSQLMARPGDYAVLIAAGAGVARAHEMVSGLRRMGMKPLLIGSSEMKGTDCLYLPSHDDLADPIWHPFVSCIPLQVLTYLEADARHLDVSVPLFGRPHGPAYDAVHVEWTKQSEIWVGGDHRAS